MIGEFETDGRFELLEFPGSDLQVEIVSFVGDLKDFWPGEPVYSEFVSEDEES